jgi:signal transduction histidine kinase
MRVETGGAAWPAAGLPDVAGRTAYRVVQEGLTNARKHAPGQPVTVTLGGGPGAGLDVSVVNPASQASAGPAFPVPGSGTGLIGLTERLELAGGGLDWRNSDGEFRLRAWLPWPEPAGDDAPVPGVTSPGVTWPGVTSPGVTSACAAEHNGTRGKRD